MNVQWWCSASGVPWEWTWRPYLGVWLVVAALGYGYFKLYRSGAPTKKIPAAGVTGLVLIWAAVDWPVGALGAGYLSAAHALKLLPIGFIAPLLLWLDVHETFAWVLAERPRFARVFNAVTHPLVAALI